MQMARPRRTLSPPSRAALAGALALLLASIAGCDRDDRPAAPPTPPEQSGGSGIPQYCVNVQRLVSLLPRRPTHVAADPQGNVYYVQESDDGDDYVYVTSAAGVPRSIDALSCRAIAKMLDLPRAKGNIQSLVCGPAGVLYAYYAGVADKRFVAAIVTYSPETQQQPALLADAARLKEASGLGDSLALAHVSLLAGDSGVSIWLRHTDAQVVLRLIPMSRAPAGVELRIAFPLVKDPTFEERILLDSEREDLAAGRGDTFYYLDRKRVLAWEIDSVGHARVAFSLHGLPESATAPVLDGRGRLVVVAGDDDHMVSSRAPETAMMLAAVHYPALVVFQDKQVVAVPREDWHAESALEVLKMRPGTLVGDPYGQGPLVFDETSGTLLRLKLEPK